jgi:signal transduction histidine kinase
MEVDEDGNLEYKVFWKGHARPIHKHAFSIGKYFKPLTLEKLKPKKGQPQDERGLKDEVAAIQHLPASTGLHSPVFIDLRFFPKRKGTFTDLDVNGLEALRWLKEHSGFALADNLFAMTGYGNDSDWLGIDASKSSNQRTWQSILTPVFFPMDALDRGDPRRNPMLALPRNAQIIGRVHIATRKRAGLLEDDSDDWLQPNMDRESLRENGAFRTLWHICRFAVEVIAHFDRTLRLQEDAAREEQNTQKTKTALAQAIAEIRSSAQIQPEYRQRIVQQLKDVQTRVDESAVYSRDAQNSLELMSMMGVIAGFMTHEFEKAMKTLADAAEMVRSLAALDKKLASAADEVSAMEKSLAHYMDYMRLFVNKARQPRPQKFKSHAQVSLVVETLSGIALAHNVDVEVDIDRTLVGPYMPVAAYHGIVANLISNSLKALVPKLSKQQRKIRVYAANDAHKHILVFSDNGIGIPDYLKDRIWDPLFTTTAEADDDNPLGSGLGLGLSVVRKVVREMKGSIDLLEAPSPGFVTAFRVVLPLNQ